MFEVDFEELKEKGFYQYVSEHYHEMSKSQLADFVKELVFAIGNFAHYVGMSKEDAYTILGNAYDSLNEIFNGIEMPDDETLITK